MYKQFWAIRVGPPSQGYFMDNKIFNTKREATEYRRSEGDWSWQKDWHVVKITEGANQ